MNITVIGQGVLLLTGIVCTLIWGASEFRVVALGTQLILGLWQLIHALVHTRKRSFRFPLNTKLNHYWILTTFFTASYISIIIASAELYRALLLEVTLLAWLISAYYIYINWQRKRTIQHRKRSGFLPNLDFT